jgi:protein involved in polysaccharide export with SLBB domain
MVIAMERLLSRPASGARAQAGRGWCLVYLAAVTLSGCYAPLFSPAIPANQLPDDYRIPWRTAGVPINYASLTQMPPPDYRLGTDDVLEVTIPDLFKDAAAVAAPFRVQVMASGEIQLPRLGPVNVGNMNLLQAQTAIIKAYRDRDILVNPNINVALAQKAAINVVVLGAVTRPGVHSLPKYENDVGHALAAAGGFNDDADDKIEVHRHVKIPPTLPAPEPLSRAPAHFVPNAPRGSMAATAAQLLASPEGHGGEIQQATALLPSGCCPVYPGLPRRCVPVPPPVGVFDPSAVSPYIDDSMQVLTIPLRGFGQELSVQDILLQPGDVIVVPNRRNEVFFVVGKLAEQNQVRLTIRERERELGIALLLPKDRDIDVVTAVAMAGYIDPIDSPTTVTVHRKTPDGYPMLIEVDLIRARYDRQETIMVQAGDIIYLNPDAHWWMRRTFDRVVPNLILAPYDALIFNRWILKPISRSN